jgi:GNAT superfamily N-acetyltransferase
MSEISVRPLTEAEWEQYRAVRLAALEESPQAFVATLAEEQGYDEQLWRDRMSRSQRLLAEVDGQAVGVASVGELEGKPQVAELFGLWVRPEARGTGVATALVQAGADTARRAGRSHLAFWVGTENGRGIAFASGCGFRPTDRRPMRVVSDDGDEEIAMVLALGQDRGMPSL